MPLTVIREAPSEARYTPIVEFQSTTPASFAAPVLHSLHRNCCVTISRSQAALIPAFRTTPAGENENADEDMNVEGVDIWVTSENIIFWTPSLSTGTEIPYLSLTLHALQANGVFMLISLNPNAASMSNADEHDEDEPVQLTILPDPESQGTEAAKLMFKALSDCQSLHPDPEQSDDEDGDPIMFEDDAEMRLEGFPTGGGWITAENVDQFRFEDAEEENRAQSGTILGPGAGAVRRREDEDENTETTGSADSDTKWRRTG